jgi:hypothetical protein
MRMKKMKPPTSVYNEASKFVTSYNNQPSEDNKPIPNAEANCENATVQAKKELYSWLFVNTIPFLVKENKIERQSKIETWLNLYQITRELNIQKPENCNTSPPINYVV